MKQLIFDPAVSGARMTIVCFLSGSGTNYRQIVLRNPAHRYIVFTNRPDCGGVGIAQGFHHDVVVLSHIPYLKDARKKYGAGNVPRNCPERLQYEQDAVRLIEEKAGKQPDLICLAGYDQWTTDWLVERYYPHILNVHPGDTTRGYEGLYWIPTARAILAGDNALRSTLFLVDKGKDTGPVLVQSRPLEIVGTLQRLEREGGTGLLDGFQNVTAFISQGKTGTYEDFEKAAGEDLTTVMERVCRALQDALKTAGDWVIYPFGVHDLIARGRVAVDGRVLYVEGKPLPVYGYRLDDQLK